MKTVKRVLFLMLVTAVGAGATIGLLAQLPDAVGTINNAFGVLALVALVAAPLLWATALVMWVAPRR